MASLDRTRERARKALRKLKRGNLKRKKRRRRRPRGMTQTVTVRVEGGKTGGGPVFSGGGAPGPAGPQGPPGRDALPEIELQLRSAQQLRDSRILKDLQEKSASREGLLQMAREQRDAAQQMYNTQSAQVHSLTKERDRLKQEKEAILATTAERSPPVSTPSRLPSPTNTVQGDVQQRVRAAAAAETRKSLQLSVGDSGELQGEEFELSSPPHELSQSQEDKNVSFELPQLGSPNVPSKPQGVTPLKVKWQQQQGGGDIGGSNSVQVYNPKTNRAILVHGKPFKQNLLDGTFNKNDPRTPKDREREEQLRLHKNFVEGS